MQTQQRLTPPSTQTLQITSPFSLLFTPMLPLPKTTQQLQQDNLDRAWNGRRKWFSPILYLFFFSRQLASLMHLFFSFTLNFCLYNFGDNLSSECPYLEKRTHALRMAHPILWVLSSLSESWSNLLNYRSRWGQNGSMGCCSIPSVDFKVLLPTRVNLCKNLMLVMPATHPYFYRQKTHGNKSAERV